MTHRFADIAFTDSVRAARQQYGSREQNARLQSNFGPDDELGEREAGFIAPRYSREELERQL